MTTHHPNPKNGKSPSTPADYADVTNHLTDSALDMQSMHTRLADLLDQVSVSGSSDESTSPAPHGESSTYQDLYSDIDDTNLAGSDEAKTNSAFGSIGSAAGAAGSAKSVLEQTSEEITSGDALFDDSTKQGHDSINGSMSEDLVKPIVSSDEQLFDNIGRNEMSDDISDIGTSETDPLDRPVDYTTVGNPDDGNVDNAADDIQENSAITIKGRTDGISIEVGAGGWRMLMVQLRHRLHQSSGFFRGGVVSLDVGNRSLTSEELANAQGVLDEHGLKLGMVRTLSQETSQAASTLGVSVTFDQPSVSVSQEASTNHESLEHFVYRGNLRSGQILRRAETILVLGDVNPGAQVESEADILVWGRLRGIAHAGATGDVNAIVAAMSMEPTQLRITDTIAIMPATDERRGLFGVKKRNPDLAPRPEVAYIAEGTIVVEPWDESKPGGIMAFRRS